MQVVYKNAAAVAFHNVKSKQFSNAWRRSSVYVYQLQRLRQLVAHESDDNRIHVLYAHKFCRLTSDVGVLKTAFPLQRSRRSTSIERVLVYIRRG